MRPVLAVAELSGINIWRALYARRARLSNLAAFRVRVAGETAGRFGKDQVASVSALGASPVHKQCGAHKHHQKRHQPGLNHA